MPVVPLSCETLATIRGGLVAKMMEKALGRMAEDLENAPDIGEWRTVSLEIAAKPIMEQGQLADVDVEFRVKGKVPTRSTCARMSVRKPAGQMRQLVFSQDAEENPAQLTLSDAGGA